MLACVSASCCFLGSEYTCQTDTTISGTADVKLSSGKTDDTGYSKEQCEQECDANTACKSFVYGKPDILRNVVQDNRIVEADRNTALRQRF